MPIFEDQFILESYLEELAETYKEDPDTSSRAPGDSAQTATNTNSLTVGPYVEYFRWRT